MARVAERPDAAAHREEAVRAGVAQRRLVQVRRSHPVQARWRAGLRVAAVLAAQAPVAQVRAGRAAVAVGEAVVPSALVAPVADVVRRVPPTAGPRSRRWR